MPRRLGQHFLTSAAALHTIAAAIREAGLERVIEVGPGRGALTERLVAAGLEVHAIELDEQLARALTERYAQSPQVAIHQGDALAVDWAQWGPAVIAGNLPYYITSPLIERFLDLGPAFPRAVFLVQAEVAQRLAATPGGREYGYLTVATQLRAEVNMLARVPPGAFAPPPKVHSAVVCLQRRAAPDHVSELLQLASRAFASKRKTLRNNLRRYYREEQLVGLPGLDRRAEQLAIGDFQELLGHLRAAGTLQH